MKPCNTCGEVKPLSDYYKSATYKDGYGYRCKICDNLSRKKYEDKYKGKLSKNRKYNQMKCKYGLSKDAYDDLVVRSEGKCNLCGKHTNILCVDHCHESGIVRGMLCSECNKGLGLLGDNINSLEKALEYLRNAEIH